MHILKAPDRSFYAGKIDKNGVFLAGSISKAWNWHEHAIERLAPYFNIYNPRRDNFNVKDKSVEQEQVKWEYDYLHAVEYIMFWFSHETVAPITLYELGMHFPRFQRGYCQIVIGMDPNYEKADTVMTQLEVGFDYSRDNIFDDLDDTCNELIKIKHDN